MFDSDELKNRLEGILENMKEGKIGPDKNLSLEDIKKKLSDHAKDLIKDLPHPESPEAITLVKQTLLKCADILFKHAFNGAKKLKTGDKVEVFTDPVAESGSLGEAELIHDLHDHHGGVTLDKGNNTIDVPLLEKWVVKFADGKTAEALIRTSPEI